MAETLHRKIVELQYDGEEGPCGDIEFRTGLGLRGFRV